MIKGGKNSRLCIMMLLLLLVLPQVIHSLPSVKAENPATFTTTGTTATKISVYLGPPTIPADGNYYYVVFVQLEDAMGSPAFAPAGGVGVSLSSSNPSVGTADLVPTIGAGATFARTWFRSTATNGTAVITASAPGYASGSATITTAYPSSSPTKLAVYATPSKLPANDATYYYPVTVQLQDATGKPAIAPSPGVTVSLSSSNTTVGTVPGTVAIATGTTFAQTWFDTTYTVWFTTITATAMGYTDGSAMMIAFAALPTKLAVYAAPPVVPAYSGTYSSIISVQLQDSSGNPARAPVATSVSLISSNTTVGTVNSPITISAGYTYATANFMATYTPGSTQITAMASGYTSGSTVMKTVAPTPVKLVVYAGPPLPADNNWHYTMVVQLQDAAGNPAKAPVGGIAVSLVSSNTAVGTVNSPITVSAGYTYAEVSFKATYVAGSTTITATASGLASGSATAITVSLGSSPSKLAVYSVPPKLPAEGGTYYYPLIVQLQNATGYPVGAPSGGIGIGLSSSNPSVCAVHAAVSISAGATYARTYFTATYTPGSATVSAVSSGYTSGSGVVTTTGATPSQLAVYASLPKVPADGGYYSPIIVVQLQDSDGNPARAPTGGVGLSLWSSNPQVATLPYPYAQISAGSTYTTNGFYSTYVPGLTYISAAVSQLLSMLSLSVTPKTVTVGGSLTISIQLWPKISTQVDMYYRVGAGPWTLVPLTIVTNSTGGYSVKVSYSSIPVGTYDLVVVWKGSSTYRGAVSEIRTFTRA